MRGFVSVLAALLAAVLFPVAITAVWTAERVVDTDGYVGAVGPLADDPDVQEALTDRLEEYAAEVLGLDRLGQVQQQALRQAIRQAVTTTVTSPAFRPVWEEANRTGHTSVLRTLRADGPGEVAPIEIGVMLNQVLAAMQAQGVPVQAAAPPGLVFTPGDRELRAAQEGFQALEDARVVVPVVWVVLVVISLVVARRRLRALALLAGASVVSVALLWPVLAGVRSVALDAVPEADRPLGEAVWDGVTQSLERSALVAVIVSAVVLVAAVVLGTLGGRAEATTSAQLVES